MAENIKSVLSEVDTLARIGGDEFIILLEDIEDHKTILNKVNHILEVSKKPIEIDKKVLNISISIGISIYPSNGNTVFDLIKNADNAMYQVKDSGKNNYRFYTKEI